MVHLVSFFIRKVSPQLIFRPEARWIYAFFKIFLKCHSVIVFHVAGAVEQGYRSLASRFQQRLPSLGSTVNLFKVTLPEFVPLGRMIEPAAAEYRRVLRPSPRSPSVISLVSHEARAVPLKTLPPPAQWCRKRVLWYHSMSSLESGPLCG
jgi:hypothetical protein